MDHSYHCSGGIGGDRPADEISGIGEPEAHRFHYCGGWISGSDLCGKPRSSLTLCIVAFLVYYFVKMPRTKEYQWVRCAMVLVLAGAVGNMLDRVFRGYVVDFFEFTFFSWPVFNVADIYVVVGVIVLAALILFVIKEEPKLEKKKDEK